MTENDIKIKVSFEIIFSEIGRLKDIELIDIISYINENLLLKGFNDKDILKMQYLFDLIQLENRDGLYRTIN